MTMHDRDIVLERVKATSMRLRRQTQIALIEAEQAMSQLRKTTQALAALRAEAEAMHEIIALGRAPRHPDMLLGCQGDDPKTLWCAK